MIKWLSLDDIEKHEMKKINVAKELTVFILHLSFFEHMMAKVLKISLIGELFSAYD